MAIDKITASGLGDGGVSTADLANDSVTTAKIADANVTLAKLSATGTKDATTYLRGDNTFSALSTTLAGLDDATVSASDPTQSTNPTSGVGHLWVNSTSGESYVLTDATTNVNVWTNIGGGDGNVPDLYAIEYLVIAGGGGGGHSAGGGGGAGGYRNSYSTETSGRNSSTESTITLTGGQTYTVVVGQGGGKGIDSSSTLATDGTDSYISGTGITTVTSIGGGAGGSRQSGSDFYGGDGGAGGGSAGDNGVQAGSGTANQGFDGGLSTTGT